MLSFFTFCGTRNWYVCEAMYTVFSRFMTKNTFGNNVVYCVLSRSTSRYALTSRDNRNASMS